jgi:hypothetical protein
MGLSREQIVSEFRSIGLNGIIFTGAGDMGPVLSLHGRKGKIAFPEDGAVHFRPDGSRYKGISPLASKLVEERDVLAEIAGGRRLNVGVFLAPFNNRRLGNARPELCCVNAFGDHYPHCLSPTNSEVCNYVLTMCQDVCERYEVEQLVLEAPSWLPPYPSWRGPSDQSGQNIWLNTMLSLSFSTSDIEGASGAGIDAEALSRRVAARVDQYLASDVDPPPAMAIEWLVDDYLADPDLVAYQRWLGLRVNEFMSEIGEALPASTRFAILPRSFAADTNIHAAGRELIGLAAAADRLEIPFFGNAVDHTAAEIFDLRRRTGQTTAFGAVLRPGQPSVHSRDQLEEGVRTVLDLGAESLAFSHFGSLRQRELRWIAEVLDSLR